MIKNKGGDVDVVIYSDYLYSNNGFTVLVITFCHADICARWKYHDGFDSKFYHLYADCFTLFDTNGIEKIK